jgi:hypothetical protein
MRHCLLTFMGSVCLLLATTALLRKEGWRLQYGLLQLLLLLLLLAGQLECCE